MPTAYLALSYSGKEKLQPVIEAIRAVLADAGIELFVFIEKFNFSGEEAKQMMQQAFAAIRNADLLIAEVSEKAIGVGIEIGYAAALQKPIIYLRHAGAEHSTTAAGSADHNIVYNDTAPLATDLSKIIPRLLVPLGQ